MPATAKWHSEASKGVHDMEVIQPVVARQGGGTAGVIRANAGAARSVAAGSAAGCSFCGRQGVPILPLRYAVIPNYLEAGRGQGSPQALFSDRESALGAVPQMQRHRYTVRTLREGYLYAYLNRPGRWQVYSVTPEGNLRLLADPDDIDEKAGKEMSAQCKRSGDNIPASFIHISDPARTPVVWLAFSSARWSASVRAKYEADPVKRMQRYDVAKLDSAPDGEKDAFALNNDAAQRLGGWVEEFIGEGQVPTDRQAYVSTAVGDIPSGRFVWESAHDVHPRAGQANALQQYAQHYRETKGQAHAVAAVVLHDAMGMLQEIDATRLHNIESMQSYLQRVARPLSVSQSIVGLKKIIEQSALAAKVADDQARGIPDVVTETIQIGDAGFGPRMYQTYTTTREERAASESRSIWNDLAKKYDEQARASFESTYGTVTKAFTKQIEMCDGDWAAWAQAPSWKAWLDDYDPKQSSECARFTRDYAACLAGGAVGEKSVAIWQAWLEGNPDEPGNPVYRAMFFNQPDLVAYLLPEGDTLNKADKLYDAVRGIMRSENFEAHATPQLKAAVASLQVALTGALARVETTLETAGKELADVSRKVAVRAQQGVILLYEGIEMTALHVQFTVGEYQRFLSERAFRKADRIAQRIPDFVDAAGRQVRSLVLAGLLNIDNPKVRDTVIEVLLWSFDSADELQRQINEMRGDVRSATSRLAGDISAAGDDIARAGTVLVGTLSNDLRPVRLGATLLSQDVAARVGKLRAGITLNSRQLAQLGRNMSSKSLRVVGNGNVILAAGSLFFQGWSLRDSMRSADRTLGRSGVESQLALLSPAVGIVGASTEVLGFSMKALGREVGERIIRGGALLAAGAAVVDAVQSGFATARTWKSGDKDAARLHGLAAAFYLVGAAVGGYAAVASSSALLGPLGIALALIALGVVFTWMALNAEDTQAEIWLDRCYFGRGQRSEGKWSDTQVGNELAALNAILVGLSAKISFSDDWFGIAERVSGYERIDVEIRIAGFDAAKAGYEWRLHARHNERGEIPMIGGRRRVPAPQHYISAAPKRGLLDWMKRDDPQKWTREFAEEPERYEGNMLVIRKSVEVLRSKFQHARLEMDYWPDYSDQGALAQIELEDED